MSVVKISIFVVLFLVAAFIIQNKVDPVSNGKLTQAAQDIFEKTPFYFFVKDDIAQGTIKGTIAYVIFSNIPFIPNPPVEPYVVFAASKGTNPILLVLTVSLVTLATTSISYFIGYFFGPNVVEKITKKEFKYSKRMSMLSVPITFLTHLLPLPIPSVFPFIFGAYKSNYRLFAIAAFLGILIRFAFVLFLFEKYSPTLSQLPLVKSLF